MDAAQPGSTHEFVYTVLGVDKVGKFMVELRDVGMEANYQMRRYIEKENDRKKHNLMRGCTDQEELDIDNMSELKKKQFVIAAVVSSDEIRNGVYSCVENFREHLITCNSEPTFRAPQRYILKDRVIVLLNSPWNKSHGEARLFDPQREISNNTDERNNFREKDYLSTMKANFYKVFHKIEKAIILLFSFYIPCTVPTFMCSKLIGQFASDNNETVIVAYQTVFRETHLDSSYNYMTKQNVYVVGRKTIRKMVNLEINHLYPDPERKIKNSNRNIWYGDEQPNDISETDYNALLQRIDKLNERRERNKCERTRINVVHRKREKRRQWKRKYDTFWLEIS